MALITRQASTVTTPFGGGTAWNSSSATGGFASLSNSCSGGSSYSNFKGCQWSNFGSALPAVSIRMKYDWSWSASANGSVDNDGFVSVAGDAGGGDFFGSAGVDLNGPGPVGDSDSDGNSGSADVNLPTNTVLSSLSTDAFCEISGTSGTSGAGNSDASVSISSLRVEVTTVDVSHLTRMM
jgi:hypothetical protein